MLVCHCNAVCDRVVRKCIRDGAQTTEEVGEACRAGTTCGGCRPSIEAILCSERGEEVSTLYALGPQKAA